MKEKEDYKIAKHRQTTFYCPMCGIYAQQTWYNVGFGQRLEEMITFNVQPVTDLEICWCTSCNKYSLWKNRQIIYPRPMLTPKPVEDMPKDVKTDYLEARVIVADSPRAATALLRLSLQKLMKHLGEKGKNLDSDIGSLEQKGLPIQIKKALDIVRVIGNNAVHPGEIDLKDDIDTAIALFSLINKIVDVMITQPKEIDEMYGNLPEGARKAIEKRDKQSE